MTLTNGQLYKTLFENMLSGFAHCYAIYDDKGKLIDWIYLEVNKAYERHTGLKDVQGKMSSDIFPNRQKTEPEVFDAYEQVAKGVVLFATFETFSQNLQRWFLVSVFSVEKNTFTITFENITEHKHHMLELEKSNIEILQAFIRALKFRDQETDRHSERVTDLTMMLAGKLKLDINIVYRGALLHDLGKMFIPDTILRKPGKLTTGEMEIMKLHPQYAYDLLSPIKFLENCLDIPYCHHERWDGTGYPRGIKGEEIPIAARLFSIIDVYDALTSHRPYREPMSHKFALNYIENESGKIFDPDLVVFFLKEMEGYESRS